MPSMTEPAFLISGKGPMPKKPRIVFIMPVSRRRATQARVRSRKLMHMGRVTSR